MRQACHTASEILHRVSDLVRPGVSTKEIDEAAAVYAGGQGQERLSGIGSVTAIFRGIFAFRSMTKWSTA